MPQPEISESKRPKVTHYGSVRLMDADFECAVLEGGRAGFIRRQMLVGIGFAANNPSNRFERFCQKIGANHSENKGEFGVTGLDVEMPHGGTAIWVPAETLQVVVKAGMVAAMQGKLTKQQAHIGQRCMQLGTALIGVGLVALIHEATGYQYVREPDALQDLFSRLIAQTAPEWHRTFHPEYYGALYKLFGFEYKGGNSPKPAIFGKITEQYVYLAVFPKELVQEIKLRKRSEKLHQWLTDEGLRLLDEQKKAVTIIAQSSVDYRDFEARCAQAFFRPGQQLSMIYPRGASA